MDNLLVITFNTCFQVLYNPLFPLFAQEDIKYCLLLLFIQVSTGSYYGLNSFSSIRSSSQLSRQSSADDPFIKAARQALKQSFSKKILLGSLVPFGIKIMEKFPSIWLSNATPLLKMTEKIISAKKTGNGGSSRKVYCIENL